MKNFRQIYCNVIKIQLGSTLNATVSEEWWP